jgi:glycosyltransferase involved in cell wall biosynthesis
MQSQTYFGADSRIHALIMEYLDKHLFEVHVAINNGDGSASSKFIKKIPGIHVRPTNFGPSINGLSRLDAVKRLLGGTLPVIISLFNLAIYIRQNEVDVIHCTEKPRDVIYGFLLSTITGAKCLIHLHVKAEKWINPAVRWAMHRVDALVGVSKFVQESILELGYPQEKTYFIHNAMDISEWDANIDGSSIREEFNIQPHTPVLITISRLFYWKGHQELLQALSLFKNEAQDFRLLIVGEDDPRGYPDGGSFTNKLKQLVIEFDLEEQVIFTGFRPDVAKLLAASDIYTMPSFEEPFGMVYLEAMAMKKPVVALDNGGTKEVVLQDYCGKLSPVNNIDKLAEDIFLLIQNPSLRKEYGENGRKRAIAGFGPDRLATDFEKLYKHVISG